MMAVNERTYSGSTASGNAAFGSAVSSYSSNQIGSASGDRDVGRAYRRVLSAGTLVGDRVRNRADEDLGKIEEIMIDLEAGRVAYAVLSFGGFLGIGDKLFAVPWESLELNTAEHEFILDVDKQTLESAPGFDKDNWPDMADRTWATNLHSHYGREPYWERSFASTNPNVNRLDNPEQSVHDAVNRSTERERSTAVNTMTGGTGRTNAAGSASDINRGDY